MEIPTAEEVLKIVEEEFGFPIPPEARERYMRERELALCELEKKMRDPGSDTQK